MTLRVISKHLALDLSNVNSIEFSSSGFGKYEVTFKIGNPIIIYRVDPAFQELEDFLNGNDINMLIADEPIMTTGWKNEVR